jgi:hypothetical protein
METRNQIVFIGGGVDCSPALDLNRPGQALQSLWETGIWLRLIAEGSHQRLHQVAQRLPLGQPGGNQGCQGPEGLRLGLPAPKTCRALKLGLELTLKFVKKDGIVLGCTQ